MPQSFACALVALVQLVYPIRAPSENEQCGQSQTGYENLELRRKVMPPEDSAAGKVIDG